MPAEWEPHEATWLAWPHQLSDWPGKFAPIPWVYGEIVRKLAPGERVRILVEPARARGAARGALLKRAGVDLGRVEFLRIPTDRGWTRDYGPDLRRRETPPARARASPASTSTAGPSTPTGRTTTACPSARRRRCGCPLVPVDARRAARVVLEGGSIDVNGRGTLLTTEECLLDPRVQVRNPGLAARGLRGGAARRPRRRATCSGSGRASPATTPTATSTTSAASSDPRTVVLVPRERTRATRTTGRSQENRERLQGMRLEDGSQLEVVPLPMPAPLVFDGMRLPASYANFYIANAAVLVPTFNDPADRVALGILAELFPDRPVVGIHAVDLVWGLGTLHCLTQQQPAAEGG